MSGNLRRPPSAGYGERPGAVAERHLAEAIHGRDGRPLVLEVDEGIVEELRAIDSVNVPRVAIAFHAVPTDARMPPKVSSLVSSMPPRTR